MSYSVSTGHALAEYHLTALGEAGEAWLGAFTEAHYHHLMAE